MRKFSKASLIKQNEVSDSKSTSMKDPIGILALFHSKEWTGGTQRIVVERSDLLGLHKKTNDSRDVALGRIDYAVRKNVELSSNRDLSMAILNYLPHTQSWKMGDGISNELNAGYIVNFDIGKVGITTRQILRSDFEHWKNTSTFEQIGHQSGSSMMGSLLKAVPTESVLTPEQKEKRLIESNSRKGLKQFFYGEDYVWAMNQKNADRKAKLSAFNK